MSAPTPAPGDDRPREGYYPDPSIPGYVRYWNGAAWVPGTSRPAPKDGEPLAPPPGVRPAQPSVEETGPHFFDEDPVEESAAPAATGTPAPRHGSAPEPASAWGTDEARRAPWPAAPQGDDPRLPSASAPSSPSSPSAPSPAAGGWPEAAGSAAAGSPGTGPAGAGSPGATADGAGSGSAGAAGTGTPGLPYVPAGTVRRARRGRPDGRIRRGGGRDGRHVRLPPPDRRSAAGPPRRRGHDDLPRGSPRAGRHDAEAGAASGGPGGAAGRTATAQGGPTSSAQAGPAAHAPTALSGPQQASPAGPRQANPTVPPQSAPAAPQPPATPQHASAPPQAAPASPQASAPQQAPASPQASPAAATPLTSGPGGGQSSWAQQVHRLAGAAGDDQPVAPWKPPVEDPFQAAARRQASARPAGLGKRLAARLLDTLVLGAVTAVAAVPLGIQAVDHINGKIEAAKLSGETVTVWLLDGTTSVHLGIVLAVLLLAGVLFEVLPTAKWGRTLGKKLLGLEVRDIEAHESPSFGAALRRWLVYSIPGSWSSGSWASCGACSTGRGTSAGTTRRRTRSSPADRPPAAAGAAVPRAVRRCRGGRSRAGAVLRTAARRMRRRGDRGRLGP